MESKEATNEKIRKLAEANPELYDLLKSEFPEAFKDEYVRFLDETSLPDRIGILSLEAAFSVGVKSGEGLYCAPGIEVITKPFPLGATAVLFKIKK